MIISLAHPSCLMPAGIKRAGRVGIRRASHVLQLLENYPHTSKISTSVITLHAKYLPSDVA